MTTIGIAIDPWKLDVFKLRLTQNGYQFTNAGAIPGGTLILKVITPNPLALMEVVKAANSECAGVGVRQ